MDDKELRKFRRAFIFFWIGQICLLISLLSFDGRFKFLPFIITMLKFFNPVGYILSLVGLFLLRNQNKQFYLSLVTFGFFVSVGLLKTVCETSTDEFYINWAKGLDWSIEILKCILYAYFLLGCRQYFKENGLLHIEKRTRVTMIVFISLIVLERLSVFLLYFNPIKANIMLNRVLTFGELFINIAAYAFLVGMLTNLFIAICKKRKELLANGKEQQEAK